MLKIIIFLLPLFKICWPTQNGFFVHLVPSMVETIDGKFVEKRERRILGFSDMMVTNTFENSPIFREFLRTYKQHMSPEDYYAFNDLMVSHYNLMPADSKFVHFVSTDGKTRFSWPSVGSGLVYNRMLEVAALPRTQHPYQVNTADDFARLLEELHYEVAMEHNLPYHPQEYLYTDWSNVFGAHVGNAYINQHGQLISRRRVIQKDRNEFVHVQGAGTERTLQQLQLQHLDPYGRRIPRITTEEARRHVGDALRNVAMHVPSVSGSIITHTQPPSVPGQPLPEFDTQMDLRTREPGIAIGSVSFKDRLQATIDQGFWAKYARNYREVGNPDLVAAVEKYQHLQDHLDSLNEPQMSSGSRRGYGPSTSGQGPWAHHQEGNQHQFADSKRQKQFSNSNPPIRRESARSLYRNRQISPIVEPTQKEHWKWHKIDGVWQKRAPNVRRSNSPRGGLTPETPSKPVARRHSHHGRNLMSRRRQIGGNRIGRRKSF